MKSQGFWDVPPYCLRLHLSTFRNIVSPPSSVSGLLDLEAKAVWSFETSLTVTKMSRRYFPEQLHLQQQFQISLLKKRNCPVYLVTVQSSKAVSYSVGTGRSFAGGKLARDWSWQLTSIWNQEFKREWAWNSTSTSTYFDSMVFDSIRNDAL